MGQQKNWKGVLFDLDGTLLDTAPDLIYACNRACEEYGLEPQSTELLKPQITWGAPAMLRQAASANGIEIGIMDGIHERMLEIYELNIANKSALFEGMEEVLEYLEHLSIQWGIVTNKHARFTEPLVAALGLDVRTNCIISGDTTAFAKPHAMPMLEAARRLQLGTQDCVYVGDARRDVEAGRNAGMETLVALYGYLDASDPFDTWGADGYLSKPNDLIEILNGLSK